MKTSLLCCCLLLACFSAQAQTSPRPQPDSIRIRLQILQNGKPLQQPSIIVQSGKPAQLAVVNDFRHPNGRFLPVGLIFDASAKLQDGRIHYSLLLTLRNQKKTKGDADAAVTLFETREWMLSGTCKAGEETRTDLGDGAAVTILCETVPLSKPPVRQ